MYDESDRIAELEDELREAQAEAARYKSHLFLLLDFPPTRSDRPLSDEEIVRAMTRNSRPLADIIRELEQQES